MSENLQYPIGRFAPKANYSKEELQQFITEIGYLPQQLRTAVRHLTEAQLNTPYRSGGWTVRQVVHHLLDSHMNGYLRLKLALTENEPTIKPYKEAAWAMLPDHDFEIEPSLQLLELIHQRWAHLLKELPSDAFERNYFHPEANRLIPLSESTANYAWHGRHHVAHITSLRERKSW